MDRMVVTEMVRDAARSRAAILAAAEELFAEHDYDQATLADIGVAAGLSRGTPSYHFGSKEELYAEVLERVFAARQAATAAAFEPVRAWCDGRGGHGALRRALTRAAEGYLDFLLNRPTFVRLIMREELGRRHGLPSVPASTAMLDAFGALREAGAARGLRPFRVEDAVLVFVGLTFAPASFGATLMRAVGRDLSEPGARRQQVGLTVDQLMRLVAG